MKNSTLIILLLLFLVSNLNSQPVIVEFIAHEDGNYELMRGGEPYYIYGVGTTNTHFFEELAKRGGNSIRTWGVNDNTPYLLNQAQKYGLTVMLGLWMNKEKDGFDYNDPEKVTAQLESFRPVIQKYKDHPALLAWSIGNEVDLDYSNLKVWNAVNEIARMINEEDGNHITLTITAGISTSKANAIAGRAPDLDMLGINAYASISSVNRTITGSNWNKPYIITEWGVNGPWEVQKTSWNAPLEPGSAEKSDMFISKYNNHIRPYSEIMPGSYAFYWNSKFEGTETWFGLWVKDETTPMIDALEYVWTGSWPENRAPVIHNLKINSSSQASSLTLTKQYNNWISLNVTDPENDSLNYEFLVQCESKSSLNIYRPTSTYLFVPDIISYQKAYIAKIEPRAKHNNQEYRLYALVRDGHDHVATASFPFRINLLYNDPTLFEENPVNDAFIADGEYSNTTFGITSKYELQINNSEIPGNKRETWLQFDLASFPVEFQKATLSLSGSVKETDTINIFGIRDAIWNDDSITWENSPANNEVYIEKREAKTEIEANLDFDITDFLKESIDNNHRLVTFILRGSRTGLSEPSSWASSESTGNPPVIKLNILSDFHPPEKQEIMIWPNPVKDIIHLKCPGNNDFREIMIYTLTGKQALTEKIQFNFSAININIEKLPSGFYFVEIKDENQVFIGRFLKN